MPRSRIAFAALGLALALQGGVLAAVRAAADDGHDHAADPSDESPRDAVAAPNLRVGLAYDYGHVDETSTVFVGPSTVTTLELDGVDGHSVEAQLVGTVPLFAYTGLNQARRSLDALDPGKSDITAYGALAEVFVRNPTLGSFSLGGAFDRLDGDGGVSANQLTGAVDGQIFFPDLGAGPLDWFTRFEFSHREVEGDGQPFNVDADVYRVKGGMRWYASPDVALVLSGTWQRVEEEFLSEDDRTGSFGIHWRLPLAMRGASLELFAAGSAGASEYKESPLRGDDRLVYGGRAGLTLRLFSGRTLVDSLRRYD